MVKDIQSWKILVERLPIKIHNFCRRYLVMGLANNSNLKKWKISNSELCSLYTKKQTQLHVFNHCLQALNRYTSRHNSIIQTFCNHLLKKLVTIFVYMLTSKVLKTSWHCSNHDNKVSQLQVRNKTIYYTVRDQILPSKLGIHWQ